MIDADTSVSSKNSFLLLIGILVLTANSFFFSIAYAEGDSNSNNVISNGEVHIFVFKDSNAILIEIDGLLDMVDSGKDDDYSIGEDATYPLRLGMTKEKGTEDQVIEYLKE